MKMDRKTIFAIVLVVVAIAVIAFQFMRPAGQKPARVVSNSENPAPAPAGAAAQGGATQVARAVERVSVYDSLIASVKEDDLAFADENLRNPMTPLIKDAKEARGSSEMEEEMVGGEINALSVGYTIEGIVWNPGKPLALVNNQVVTVGEKLDDGSLITEITHDTVRFTKDGKKYFLVFREDR